MLQGSVKLEFSLETIHCDRFCSLWHSRGFLGPKAGSFWFKSDPRLSPMWKLVSMYSISTEVVALIYFIVLFFDVEFDVWRSFNTKTWNFRFPPDSSWWKIRIFVIAVFFYKVFEYLMFWNVPSRIKFKALRGHQIVQDTQDPKSVRNDEHIALFPIWIFIFWSSLTQLL